MYLKDNMRNQKMSELYTADKKTKYSSNLNDFLKSVPNFYEKLYSKTAIFCKILNKTKISNEKFHLFEVEIFKKFINIFLNELTHISRTEVISAIYKKVIKKTLQTIDSFHFKN